MLTREHRSISPFTLYVLCYSLIACGGKAGAVRVAKERVEIATALSRFQEYRLEPARVAPPSVSAAGGLVVVGDVQGIARLVHAEDQPWNEWPGEGSRLFNNTIAHWFQVDIGSRLGQPVRWLPKRTKLELNEEGNILEPAETQEELLEELLFFAYQQERHVLDGDLVDRVRGSGQLRAAYLDVHRDHLQGLLAFPLHINADTAEFLGRGGPPADYHVVSMRLTVGIETPKGVVELVWLFD